MIATMLASRPKCGLALASILIVVAASLVAVPTASAQSFDLDVRVLGSGEMRVVDYVLTEDDVTLNRAIFEDRRIVLGFRAPGNEQLRFVYELFAPAGKTFEPGHYPNVLYVESGSPDHYLMGDICDGPGFFTIHEATRDGDVLTSLSLDITSFCEDPRDPWVTAHVRFNASADPPPKADTDGDGIDDTADNCPLVANEYQLNADGDFLGDACDAVFDDSIFTIHPGIGPADETRLPLKATPNNSVFHLDVNDAEGGIDVVVNTGIYPRLAVRPESGVLTPGTFTVNPDPAPGEVSMELADHYGCWNPTGTVVIHEYEPDPTGPEGSQILHLSLDYELTCSGDFDASGSLRWNATPVLTSACDGRTPTHVGTPGDDTIVGTDGSDVILGGAGNDTIFGGRGNDFICGGPGNDVLWGEAGRDTIEGGLGDDTLAGGSGADTAAFRDAPSGVTVDLGAEVAQGSGADSVINFNRVWGSDFNDTLIGTGAANALRGLGGNDIIRGGSGHDILVGGDGDDLIYGGSGGDELLGDAGNDFLFGIRGDDTLEGGAGDDVLIGGQNDDQLKGGAGDDVMEGQTGVDNLVGGSGDDTAFPGPDSDTASGGSGTDMLSFLGSNAAVVANLGTGTATGEGADTFSGFEWLQGSRYGDDLTGSGVANWIFGERGTDLINGGGGHDVLFGGDANDELHGGRGADTLVGGLRNDVLDGGPGEDTASYYNAPGSVTVNLTTQLAAGGHGKDTMTSIEGVVGGPFEDRLTGNPLGNWMEGRSSDDLLTGVEGDDLLFGFGGSDSIWGGPGDDYLEGMFGVDALDGQLGTDFCVEQTGTVVNCELFPDVAYQRSRRASQPSAQWRVELPELWWRAVPQGR